jgi:hypothetical protein
MNAILGLLCCGLLLSPLFPAESAADRQADQLVFEAADASAGWNCFPGFLADFEVQRGGRKCLGRVIVEPNGRVHIEHVAGDYRRWSDDHVCKIVRGRLPADHEPKKSWAFASTQKPRDPIGRCVYPADNPFGELHWIRERQIHAIDFRSGKQKHRLTTLKTEKNVDGKHLPAALVLHSWNSRTQELESTETTLLSWRRVGRFDLPATIDVLSTDSRAETSSGRIVISNHRLLDSTDAQLAGR